MGAKMSEKNKGISQIKEHMAGHTDTWLKRGVSVVGDGDKEENRLYTWERIPEESDKGDRLTMIVVLEMDSTLGEESGLVCKDFVEDELGAILGDHAGDEGAVCNEIELWRPRVSVRRVHAARSKETGGYKTWEGEIERRRDE